MPKLKVGLGLRGKLILFVVIGIVVASTAIGLVRVLQEKQKITGLIEDSGRERALMLSLAVSNLIVGYDYGNMESIVDKLIEQPDVLSVAIHNTEGKAMAQRAKRTQPGLSFNTPVRFGADIIGDVELTVSLEKLNLALAQTYKSIALEQLFFGLVLGLLVYFATSRAVVTPITRVSEMIGNIISSQNPSTADVLLIDSSDEIGHLATMFNRMNQTISDYHGRLHQKIDLANSALVQTNEELHKRSVELERRTQSLEKALEMVEKLATTDALTGLANRRSFDDVFEQSFARAQRHNDHLTLVLIDVDRFKHINDTYGHGAGDTALKAICTILNNRLRKSDFAARLGGDEFAVVFDRTDAQAGLHFVRDLLEGVAAHEFMLNGTAIHVTLSIGVAQRQDASASPEALYYAADKALYSAKENGRNQYAVYAAETEITLNVEGKPA
jgi:diguanylate cyclase (GGDEF)-like protein